MYSTLFGTHTYRDVPKDASRYGISLFDQGDYTYWLADPVKAVCDELYIRELEELMFEDLRMDEDAIFGLDVDDVSFLADRYHCRNVTRLAKYLQKARDDE